MASTDFSFATFSQNPFYENLNARLVAMAEPSSGQRIVDLACGTGGVTKLILEQLRGARDSVIIAMDHSAGALKQAMDDLKAHRDNAVQFVQSQVEQVSESLKERADTIIFCNAIHYIPDKDSLVVEISRALNPGGKFAFNTSFYEGGQVPESLQFYRKWMFKSARTLRREYGLSTSEGCEGRVPQAPDRGRVPGAARTPRLPDRPAGGGHGSGAYRGLAGHQHLRGLHHRHHAWCTAQGGERITSKRRPPDLRGDGDNARSPQLA